MTRTARETKCVDLMEGADQVRCTNLREWLAASLFLGGIRMEKCRNFHTNEKLDGDVIHYVSEFV